MTRFILPSVYGRTDGVLVHACMCVCVCAFTRACCLLSCHAVMLHVPVRFCASQCHGATASFLRKTMAEQRTHRKYRPAWNSRSHDAWLAFGLQAARQPEAARQPGEAGGQAGRGGRSHASVFYADTTSSIRMCYGSVPTMTGYSRCSLAYSSSRACSGTPHHVTESSTATYGQNASAVRAISVYRYVYLSIYIYIYIYT